MDSTQCVVHTKQTVVHMLQNETTVKGVLIKEKSAVVVIDAKHCLTHCSSTFNIDSQLLKVKNSVYQMTTDIEWDSLLTSEWQKLSNDSTDEKFLPLAAEAC